MGNRQWRRHNERDSRRIERRKAAARASAEKSEEPRAISGGGSSTEFGVNRDGEIAQSISQISKTEFVYILDGSKVYHAKQHNQKVGEWKNWTANSVEQAMAEGFRPCRICYKDR